MVASHKLMRSKLDFFFFHNGPLSDSFSFIFGLFNQILQQINMHLPVTGAGIRTHNLLKSVFSHDDKTS